MRIKTNIYHFSASNGLSYEDFTGYSETVYARNEDEAVKKGVAILKCKLGQDAEICHPEATLVFENVEMEVPTPSPFTVDVDGVEFTYFYDLDRLGVKTYGDPGTISKRYIKDLANYFNALVQTLE